MKWRIPPACAYFAPATTTDLKMTLIDQLHIEQVTRINLLSLVVDSERDGRTGLMMSSSSSGGCLKYEDDSLDFVLVLLATMVTNESADQSIHGSRQGLAKGSKANKQVR